MNLLPATSTDTGSGFTILKKRKVSAGKTVEEAKGGDPE